MSAPTVYTIGTVALRYGCKPWQVRRLFERGLLPPAPRLGAYRVVHAHDLPQVEAALVAAGYLAPRKEGAPCR